MPLDATALVTLSETKAHLNIDESDTSQDVELELFINSATDVVEQHVGPVINRTVTETVPGGSALVLDGPVVSVTSVTGVYGSGGNYTAGDLFVDSSGLVYPAYGAVGFTHARLEVEYVAGLGATAPSALKLAALIIIKHLWETQRGASPEALFQGVGAEEPAPFGFAFAVPNRALELLAPYRRPPAVA